MSITPKSPAINQQGWVQTWVTSQWKNPSIPGQLSAEINTFVVGGTHAALDALAGAAVEVGAARVARINVRVASHTARLTAASAEFLTVLTRAPIRRPPLPAAWLLSGLDGSVVRGLATGLDNLARQISHRIEWAECLQSCVEGGARAFLELGPGHALSEMAASAYPDIAARSIEDFRTIEGVHAWLAKTLG
ncbi:hypothetical protein [Ollibium composti]|uniref:Malonyl-CoA:ACP transacylase (MAT) domain-containing protein n=1 Tax=Ollibium composti TaxID=2675109 RepID=A0ABY2QCU3_9HYPH|nr:hypothetical protein [Mesorhizobium composti]THF60088.1 hypothetical protein E6C48_03325 [Mesorhizobium composti]